MDKKFQDIHIRRNDLIYNLCDEFVERGVELQSICFYETYIIITYRRDKFEYAATIHYDELEKKSIIID